MPPKMEVLEGSGFRGFVLSDRNDQFRSLAGLDSYRTSDKLLTLKRHSCGMFPVTSPYNGLSPPCLKLSQQFVVPA